MTARFSQAYITHLQRGPFPNQIDPWAEAARYLHPIHNSMIDGFLAVLQEQLLALGYEAGRETSLQVVNNRQSDVYVLEEMAREAPRWDYSAAATALNIEPGVALVNAQPELEMITVVDLQTGDLVTVVEIISPSNKANRKDMMDYQEQRQTRFLRRGVNVVEIDTTRSVRRLVNDPIIHRHAYHVAIFLPHDVPRALTCDVFEPLPRFALPLRGEVISVAPQPIYDAAYQRVAAAGKINREQHYALDALPFSSTMTEQQKTEAMATVQQWQKQLAVLAQEKPEIDG